MESCEITQQASSILNLTEEPPRQENRSVDVDMPQELEDVDIEDTQTVIGSKKRKAHTERSIHWNDYIKMWVVEKKENEDSPITTRKGKCKRCGILIAADAKNGTNGLKNHTISCLRKLEATSGQTMLKYTPSVDGTGAGSLSSWKFDYKAIRLALCEMIIIDELPFIFVEREGFKRFVDRLCPQFQIPSRQTIRTDCVKLFLERKDSLKYFFKKKGIGRVSITTDCWTSVNNTNFICVTAHCIGKDWVLHKKIISFCKIVSHKGNDIGESIIKSLKEWELVNVLCCTVDNASANDGAVKYVKSYLETWKTNVLGGKYLHMRCAAHILNLVVSSGLEEIGLSVRRVREAVKWIKASPARSEQFINYVQAFTDITCKKSLCMDVPTRWNSTYLMLESAQPYEAVFKLFRSMHSDYVDDLNQKKYKDLPIGSLEESDWVNVRKMMEYLKKFYELTLLVSGTRYVTSHLFFAEMCDVFDLIYELELSEEQEISSMAKKMRLKVGKYWLEEIELNTRMNKIIYIAALLDPRQKMKHVEKCLNTVYGVDRAAILVREVTNSVSELYDFYKRQLTPSLAQKSNPSVVPRKQKRSDRRGSCSLLRLQSIDEEVDDTDTSEITLYFTEKQHKIGKDEVDEFDILQWWMKNSPRFPVMSEMARDILAILISSVASECAFSTGGRVLSPYRSSLTPSMVEALICAEDWLKSSSNDKKDEEGVSEEELEKEFQMVLDALEHGVEATRTIDSV